MLAHALPTILFSGWLLFLYGRRRGPAPNIFRTRSGRRTEMCFHASAHEASLRYRCGRGSPRPSALHMDVAGRRRRFLDTLASDQKPVLSAFRNQTASLAAQILGAPHSQRTGSCAPYRLHSLQPGQAWICCKASGLAVQQLCAICRAGRVFRRLGCVKSAQTFLKHRPRITAT